METAINFLSSQSIESFKAENGNQPIEVRKTASGKMFFRCGSTTGWVSKSGFANPVISKCEAPDSSTGELREFYLLHSQGSTVEAML